MTEIDFDTFESGLQVGLEVEYPAMDPDRGDEYLVDRGRQTNSLQNEIGGMPPSLGRNTYDGTVGLEVVSDVLNVEDAANWYRDVVDYVESNYDAPFQPTGLLDSGSTAGLHIHLSSLSSDEARELYEISQTPWAKVLFCSSIAESENGVTWPVFRGGSYCRMNSDITGGRYNCVNSRGNGHYEWRMPEPVSMDHIGIIMKFLDFFHQDPSIARDYAQELLDDGDDRITAIQRAERVGMNIDGMPVVERAPSNADPDNFYSAVEEGWHLPEIYRVEYNGDDYYAFESDLAGEFEAEGVTFSHDDVLAASSLDAITDSEVREGVTNAFRSQTSENIRETEATNELKKIMKKKKMK